METERQLTPQEITALKRMVRDAGKIGFLSGVLIGLKYQVDDRLKAAIDSALARVHEEDFVDAAIDLVQCQDEPE